MKKVVKRNHNGRLEVRDNVPRRWLDRVGGKSEGPRGSVDGENLS